ncbi:MAG: Rsd/AlgQ family anti-sigma factor [Pseudomonadota bacterium]
MSQTTSTSEFEKLNQTIHVWLRERQELIVLYCGLCGVRELSSEIDEIRVLEKLKGFCQILVDYLSAGHFEIFEEIFELHEETDNVKQVFKDVYPSIEQSTPVLLDFNDVYDTEEHSRNALSELPIQLDAIGQTLTDRFDLEDKIIALHQ